MTTNRKFTYLTLLALLVAGCLTIQSAPAAASPSTGDSQKITQLLSDTKDEAHLLERDVVEIEGYIRADASWQTHSGKLAEIRNHINKGGKLLAQLEEERASGSPWQQKAIDEIRPLLQELANNTQSAVDFFTENKDRFHMGTTYSDYLKANVSLAKDLAALITDYVDYGFHKTEFNRLGEKVVASER